MDTVKCNSIVITGPGLWKILHSTAVRATTPDSKSFFIYFFEIFKDMIRCKHCLDDLNLFVQSHELHKYHDIIIDGIDVGYFKFTWELHNYVNLKLNKPLVSLTDAYKYYTVKHFDCRACIKLD